MRSVAPGFEEKGARFGVKVMTPGESKSPAYLKRNPFGRVPTSVHGDFALDESRAILRYLDRILPGPRLTPQDPQAEARINQLCGTTDWYVMPQITIGITFGRLAAPKIGRPVEERQIEASLPGAGRCIAEIARLLGDRPFLAGDAVSIADLLLGSHLAFFAQTAESAEIIEPHRALAAWIDRMNARPSFRNTVPARLAAKAATKA